MAYIVLMGTLSSIHSLTHSLTHSTHSLTHSGFWFFQQLWQCSSFVSKVDIGSRKRPCPAYVRHIYKMWHDKTVREGIINGTGRPNPGGGGWALRGRKRPQHNADTFLFPNNRERRRCQPHGPVFLHDLICLYGCIFRQQSHLCHGTSDVIIVIAVRQFCCY